MPHYSGLVHLSAANAFYNPLKPGTNLTIHPIDSGGSALTASFNEPWAYALDLFEGGEIDAFAMIHADVGAQDGCLDILHREMEKSGADMVSAAIPIKDKRCLYSTAVDDTGDEWLVRRLTGKQLEKLPTTFTDEDVGGPLLLNTGLFLLKLGPWCLQENPDGSQKFCFEVYNQIRKMGGRRRAFFKSEDWDFSRQLRRAGLKQVATKAVTINHHGEFAYANYVTWGQDEDTANTKKVEPCPKDGTLQPGNLTAA